jgi:hypothetical protein
VDRAREDVHRQPEHFRRDERAPMRDTRRPSPPPPPPPPLAYERDRARIRDDRAHADVRRAPDRARYDTRALPPRSLGDRARIRDDRWSRPRRVYDKSTGSIVTVDAAAAQLQHQQKQRLQSETSAAGDKSSLHSTSDKSSGDATGALQGTDVASPARERSRAPSESPRRDIASPRDDATPIEHERVSLDDALPGESTTYADTSDDTAAKPVDGEWCWQWHANNTEKRVSQN